MYTFRVLAFYLAHVMSILEPAKDTSQSDDSRLNAHLLQTSTRRTVRMVRGRW